MRPWLGFSAQSGDSRTLGCASLWAVLGLSPGRAGVLRIRLTGTCLDSRTVDMCKPLPVDSRTIAGGPSVSLREPKRKLIPVRVTPPGGLCCVPPPRHFSTPGRRMSPSSHERGLGPSKSRTCAPCRARNPGEFKSGRARANSSVTPQPPTRGRRGPGPLVGVPVALLDHRLPCPVLDRLRLHSGPERLYLLRLPPDLTAAFVGL